MRCDRPVRLHTLPDGFEAELVKAGERGQVRASEGSVRHVEVFQMGSVRTSILRRPRRLSPHRRADHGEVRSYALDWEEPANTIDDDLSDAVAVLDAFHVVKLATAVVDDVRRRVQQDTCGHRGRRDDPLYRIRNILRAGQDRLTDRQRARLTNAFTARDEHVEVEVAWLCAQQVRSVFHQETPAAGKAIAEMIPTHSRRARSQRSPASAGP